MNTVTTPADIFGPVLVGMRGTGKTEVGRALAGLLDLAFVDADTEFERRYRCRIAAAFAEHGEAWFRQREEALLTSLLQRPHCVLSTGGGAVLHASIRGELQRRATIWLTARCSLLAARIAGSDRPRLSAEASSLTEELALLYRQRQPLYRQVASVTFASDEESVAALAQRIAQYWQQWTRITPSGRRSGRQGDG